MYINIVKIQKTQISVFFLPLDSLPLRVPFFCVTASPYVSPSSVSPCVYPSSSSCPALHLRLPFFCPSFPDRQKCRTTGAPLAAASLSRSPPSLSPTCLLLRRREDFSVFSGKQMLSDFWVLFHIVSDFNLNLHWEPGTLLGTGSQPVPVLGPQIWESV